MLKNFFCKGLQKCGVKNNVIPDDVSIIVIANITVDSSQLSRHSLVTAALFDVG